ncbi:MAG: tRNA pseudouridine(55) synthase TruB [Elusimicrobiota bacterium]|jgi:tRNA pseudouridine55 synthase|nr:tRNA pseudouridine(55) synthase TruB [Elusimicrobiota bacterium]
MSSIRGMLLIDKPTNATSFKICNTIKRVLDAKKTGHCGTLDPLATGLLIILINEAVKKQNEFMKQDKIYSASFKLGIRTDSADTDGKIIEQKDYSYVNEILIKDYLKSFLGEIEQIPPMFSALKVKGQKLCELARKGIEIERKPRKVNIKNIEMLSFSNGILDLKIECSSGTYIRSIADDLGKLLGCGAAVCALRREKSGIFDVKDAVGENDFYKPEILKSKIIQL